MSFKLTESEAVFLTHQYQLSPHNTDCEALSYRGGEGQPGKRDREKKKRDSVSAEGYLT